MTLAPSVDRSRDRLLNREVVAGAVRATDLVGQECARGAPRRPHLPLRPGLPVRLSMAAAIVPGDVRPVAVVVHRVAVEDDEVVAADVVGRQVGVGVVDAGVDHRHGDRRNCREDRPRFGRVDVGVRRAVVEAELAAEPGEAEEPLPGVVQGPLLVEVVVARYHFGARRRARGARGCGERSSVRRRGRSGCAGSARWRRPRYCGPARECGAGRCAGSRRPPPRRPRCAHRPVASALTPGLNFTRISPATNRVPPTVCADERTVNAAATRTRTMSALLERTGILRLRSPRSSRKT